MIEKFLDILNETEKIGAIKEYLYDLNDEELDFILGYCQEKLCIKRTDGNNKEQDN